MQLQFGINKKEIAPAVLMLFIGMATVLGSLEHQIGSLNRMGPGYFPLLLGVALMLVALLIAFSPPSVAQINSEPEPEDTHFVPQYRAWVLVLLAIVLFVVLGRHGGLIPATFALAFVATLADRKNTLRTALIVAVVLTAMAVLVFYYGLQMQFPLWRWGA